MLIEKFLCYTVLNYSILSYTTNMLVKESEVLEKAGFFFALQISMPM